MAIMIATDSSPPPRGRVQRVRQKVRGVEGKSCSRSGEEAFS